MRWSKFQDGFKNAFSVSEESVLTAEDEAMLAKIADFIVRRRMSAPAIVFLQSVKPLNFVGSQGLLILQPLAELLTSPREFARAQKLLERREGIELLVQQIEERENHNPETKGQGEENSNE